MSDDLAGFVLACLAADEGEADEWHNVLECSRAAPAPGPLPCDCDVPARILAECAAKGTIVEQYRAAVVDDDTETDQERGWQTAAVRDALEQVVRALAAPFAGRPGFREEWRL